MKIVLMILVFMGTLFIFSLDASAYNTFKGAQCSGGAGSSSAVCTQPATNPLYGPDGVIAKIANIVAWVAGTAAIIVIVYAGIKYITSGGEPEKTRNAKNAIVYALIGIAVILLSRVIIYFMLNTL